VGYTREQVAGGAQRLSALNGIAFRIALITALYICLLFVTAITGHALTPTQNKALGEDVSKAAKALEENPKLRAEGAKVIEWLEGLEVLPKDGRSLVLWLILTGALGTAAATGLASVAGDNKETPAIPEAIRSLEYGVRESQDAEVTVMAPRMARPREDIVVQVIIHTPDRGTDAQSKAQQLDPRSQPLAWDPLTIQLNMNDAIKVKLDCEGATIVERVKRTYWNGRWVLVQFQMQPPDTESELKVTAKVEVFVNSVVRAETIFWIVVSPNAPDLVSSVVDQHGRSYRKLFFSYATEDKLEALRTWYGLKKITGIEPFMDLVSLRAGEHWERRLEEEIDRRDVFVLFWSRHARASDWVTRETDYALKCSKRDPINPRPKVQILPLEELDTAGSPPESLSRFHLNDPDLQPILAEQRRRDIEQMKDQEQRVKD